MTTYNMILKAMKNFEENGNVYAPFNELMARCQEKNKELSRQEFCSEVDQLVRDGLLEQEEDRLYFPRNKSNEDIVAGILAEMLFENQLPHTQIPDVLSFGGITLTEEQKRAVSLALDHRLSIIQGGAGSGKTTMVRAIIQQYSVTCGDRQAVYEYDQVMQYVTLAYAATVHKVQGSEYDTIIFPVSKRFSPLLSRNLFYTAISRAKKQVILVGDSEALEFALKNYSAQRYSMLVDKVNRACCCMV